ncbi:hypothetical protein FNO01nite_17310 [Flavobacterium noncentrifugens]|uniref:Uncharacterized protein n=1 Tax=Flavobacterium noncentrifugens TaxID=1128970 RepID=A0A1G8WUM4_9FLAO|nr:hypothetical protein [Flavobacterium noncentrifugens]GEP51059.1 hypothetical protein FNO01nite_17310 [Flavobacterium noncentrifugens]SDJ81934.1 hypothetical protein SAMN04487935_1957 [Flavobacterium noncentrifugens]
MKHIAIYILFAISTSLIMMNRYSPLYINNSTVHFTVLFIAVASFIIMVGHFFGKLKSNRSILFTYLMVGVLCYLKSFLTWGGDWKTQTVVYQNTINPNRTIEFQMRGDRFAFGYKKRIIERLKIIPAFDWTTDIDTTAINPLQWERLDLDVNEMKFAPEK